MSDGRPLTRGVLACVAILLLPGSAGAQELTESEAVTRALQENARLRAARTRPATIAAEQQLRRLPPNPAISFQQERSAGVTDRFLLFEQELPLTGRVGRLKQAGQAAVTAADLRVSRSAFEVRQDTRAAFTGLLAAQVRLAEVSKAVTTLTGLARRLADRENAGDGSRFDRLRAEREVAELRAEQTLIEADVATARASLGAFLGLTGVPALVAKGSMDPVTVLPALDDVLASARAKRPDLLAVDADIQALEFEREAAGRLTVPYPVIGGGWKQTALDHAAGRNGYAFSAGMVLPVFSRGKADSAVAAAGLLAARAERDALTVRIDQEVRVAHARAHHLRSLVAAYESDALERSRELVRIATLAYDEGELGILELLDAHRSLVTAELRAMEFRSAARAAAISLDLAAGEELTR